MENRTKHWILGKSLKGIRQFTLSVQGTSEQC